MAQGVDAQEAEHEIVKSVRLRTVPPQLRRASGKDVPPKLVTGHQPRRRIAHRLEAAQGVCEARGQFSGGGGGHQVTTL